MSVYVLFVFFRQKTAYEMRISDWSSDVCSSDLQPERRALRVDAVHRIFAAGNFHRFARGGAAVGADRCKRAVDIVAADLIGPHRYGHAFHQRHHRADPQLAPLYAAKVPDLAPSPPLRAAERLVGKAGDRQHETQWA